MHRRSNPHRQVETAYAELEGIYLSAGYNIPSDVDRSLFVQALQKIYVPDEALTPIYPSQETEDYMTREVHPQLRRELRDLTIESTDIGHAVGKVIGASIDAKTFKLNPAIIFSRHSITFPHNLGPDGTIPFRVEEPGLIVDYGMGINGLVGHLDCLRSGHYEVEAILKNYAEVTVIEGLLEHYGLTDEQVICSKGLQVTIEAIISDKLMADAVIASRVHMAGDALRFGIRKASRLLKLGGLLVANGRRQVERGLSYDEVAKDISRDRRLKVLLDLTYPQPTPEQRAEGVGQMRLIVAEKQDLRAA